MSWFGSSATELDHQIADATSESVPNGDIDFAAALEISDSIRSKAVSPKDAMRALKKRFLATKNPNMQRSALKLIDFCIKNGGEQLLTYISSKEFMDPLVGVLHDKSLNREVKAYLLELIQTWSIMFSTNPKLTYVNDIYKKLQKEGYTFPAITDYVDSTLIESKVAPEWEDSDACMLCSNPFTFLNRKHHCRSCGGVFCQEHSAKECELPELGITVPVRVCDTCYDEHKEHNSKAKATKKKKNKTKSEPSTEDDDLKRAIELSLQEAGMMPEKVSQPPTVPEYDEEDAEMKAAMAASLADFKKEEAKRGSVSQSSAPSLYPNLMPQIPEPNDYLTVQPVAPVPQPQVVPSNEITAVEDSNVTLFATMLDNYKKTPASQRRPITEDATFQQMYRSMQPIRAKVTAQLVTERAQLDKYRDMYSKIFAISKIYDEILKTRLEQAKKVPPQSQYGQYAQPQQGGQYAQPQSTGQSSQYVQYAQPPSQPPQLSQPQSPSPQQQYYPSSSQPQQYAPHAQTQAEYWSSQSPSSPSWPPAEPSAPPQVSSNSPVARIPSLGSISYAPIPPQSSATPPQKAVSPSVSYGSPMSPPNAVPVPLARPVAQQPQQKPAPAPEPVNLIDL